VNKPLSNISRRNFSLHEPNKYLKNTEKLSPNIVYTSSWRRTDPSCIGALISSRGAWRAEEKSSGWCIFIVAWIIESETKKRKKKNMEKGTKHQQNLPPWINNTFYGAHRETNETEWKKGGNGKFSVYNPRAERAFTFIWVFRSGVVLQATLFAMKNHKISVNQQKCERVSRKKAEHVG
jgi:hypothetical protein